MDIKDNGLHVVLKRVGSVAALAQVCGVNRTRLYYWLRVGVPLNRVVEVSRRTGISKAQLRPDVFGR